MKTIIRTMLVVLGVGCGSAFAATDEVDIDVYSDSGGKPAMTLAEYGEYVKEREKKDLLLVSYKHVVTQILKKEIYAVGVGMVCRNRQWIGYNSGDIRYYLELDKYGNIKNYDASDFCEKGFNVVMQNIKREIGKFPAVELEGIDEVVIYERLPIDYVKNLGDRINDIPEALDNLAKKWNEWVGGDK